jgi:hypothetical protein
MVTGFAAETGLKSRGQAVENILFFLAHLSGEE